MRRTLVPSPQSEVAGSPWEALARMRIFWLGTGGVLAAAGLVGRSLEDVPGFALIAVTALLPALLWCRRLAHGIPIYPVFSLGTIWTFGFPLIAQHPLVISYSSEERWAAAATVALTNLTGCGCWFLFTRRAAPRPTVYRGFRFGSGDLLFFGALGMEIVFNVVTSSWELAIDPAIFSVVRAIVQALASLAIFVLGYRAGTRELGARGSWVYGLTMMAVMVSNLSSVLMVNALADGALALMAFALGRGRLPVVALLFFLGGALFLQAGKAAVREKYWSAETAGAPISFARFAVFMSDWIWFSWEEIFSSGAAQERAFLPGDGEEPQSLTERASLLHLFLLIQRMSPAETPYLQGVTYAIIPRLLVPRLIDEGKARSHLGTYLLAIHYGVQRPEDTSATTIGFGLINEAMANFGYAGCAGLGGLLGTFYGWVGRWSSSHPLLSWRALFSILVLTVAFENEFTAGVYVTTLFQGTCALLLFSLPTMRRVGLAPEVRGGGWSGVAEPAREPRAALSLS